MPVSGLGKNIMTEPVQSNPIYPDDVITLAAAIGEHFQLWLNPYGLCCKYTSHGLLYPMIDAALKAREDDVCKKIQ